MWGTTSHTTETLIFGTCLGGEGDTVQYSGALHYTVSQHMCLQADVEVCSFVRLRCVSQYY